MNFQQTKFVTSAAKLNQLVTNSLAEVAFAGRSNAGKSSAINTITGIHGLAKTSKRPGRTQLINFFEIAPSRYLVDLPGYGYAKVSLSIKEAWQETLGQYLEQRAPLKGLILIIDIRHPMKDMDQQMLNFAIEANLPTHVLLTKSDKLSHNQAKLTLLNFLKSLPPEAKVTAQTFSSLKKEGVDEARQKIIALLG
jgi:GTP-binding protein